MFYKMLQGALLLINFMQFESFERDIDTNEAFYFE